MTHGGDESLDFGSRFILDASRLAALVARLRPDESGHYEREVARLCDYPSPATISRNSREFLEWLGVVMLPATLASGPLAGPLEKEPALSAVRWTRRHLLGLEELSAAEITLILDQAAEFKRLAAQGETKLKHLAGVVVANLFFENSTRTRTSFSLAAKRLSADTIDFSAGGSSLSKGETFIDTARNIEAMGVNQVVVRHSTPGAPLLLSQHLQASVLNAGDGTHEHPTQGLLDVFTIRERVGHVAGLTVALVGDILHSRVARSNIWGLTKLGAHVIVCGPATLIPPHIERLGVEVAHDFDKILPRCDCINLLRIQFERQRSGLFPSITEYAHLFGMNGERLKKSKRDIVILAPGPINRGVELTPDVADGGNSVILDQVTNGLFIRMACLYLLHQRRLEETEVPCPRS